MNIKIDKIIDKVLKGDLDSTQNLIDSWGYKKLKNQLNIDHPSGLLYKLAWRGRTEVIKKLLPFIHQNSPKISLENTRGKNYPIYIATKKRKTETLRVLAKHFYLKEEKQMVSDIICISMERGYLEIVNEYKNSSQSKALLPYLAAITGNIKLLKKFLKNLNKPFIFDTKNDNFEYISDNGNLQFKLDHPLIGAVKCKDKKISNQCIFEIIPFSNKEIIQKAFLLSSQYNDLEKINIFIKFCDHDTILKGFFTTIKWKCMDSFKKLLPYLKSEEEYSEALISAAFWGNLEIIKILIPLSDPLTRRSKALNYAARAENYDIVNLLFPLSSLKKWSKRDWIQTEKQDSQEPEFYPIKQDIKELLLTLEEKRKLNQNLEQSKNINKEKRL